MELENVDLVPTMDRDLLAVIVDPGSDTIKAGLNSEDYPKVVMQDIGPDRKKRVRYKNSVINGKQGKEGNITGKTIQEQDCGVVYKHPIEHGLVVNWDIMEEVYRHLFYEKMKINISDYNILVTEVPLNPKRTRERLAELMFDKFGVHGFYLKDTSSLSLLSTGRTTGAVIASGDAVTTAAVVNEGSVLRNTIPKTFYAGKDSTYHLKQLLRLKEHSSESLEHGHVLRAIKETACFVSENFENDFQYSRKCHGFETNYRLPDGSTLTLNEERFLCPEGLFQPQLFDCNCPGLHQQLLASIQFSESIEPNINAVLWSNVVLAGGNMMFPGLAKRLATELNKICPASANVRIVDRADRHHAAWVGGTIFSLMDTTQWISKQEYCEYGSKIVNKKCF